MNCCTVLNTEMAKSGQMGHVSGSFISIFQSVNTLLRDGVVVVVVFTENCVDSFSLTILKFPHNLNIANKLLTNGVSLT